MRIRCYHIKAQARVSQTICVHDLCSITLKQVCDFCASLINCYAHIFTPELRVSRIKARKQIIPVERRAVEVLIHVHKRGGRNYTVAGDKPHCGFVAEVANDIECVAGCITVN